MKPEILKQKPPAAGCHDVLTRIIEEYQNSEFNRREIIRALILRSDEGREKYGVRLQSHNGRNALIDAYQEVLDLIMYLFQDAIEHGSMASRELCDSAFEMAENISSLLADRLLRERENGD